MNTLKITRAGIEDLDEIDRIERESSYNPWPREMSGAYLQKSESNAFFLAYSEGEPAGYISLSFVLDEGSVMNLGVKKSFRRLGIGRELVKELKNFAKSRKLSFLYLEVREKNLAAIALYESEGFEFLAKRIDYYDDPKDDALIMKYEVEE